MIWLLAFGFLLVALLYASVGFGGGSSYIALLSLSDIDYRLSAILALLCNILVVSGNCWRYWHAGQLKLRPYWGFLLGSIPLSWLGGRLAVSEFFHLSFGYKFAARRPFHALATIDAQKKIVDIMPPSFPIAFASGGILGFVAGLVAIGGGIFLAPLLHIKRWGEAGSIAAFCSFFILINSVFGLIGQMQKNNFLTAFEAVQIGWPLFAAVIIGGGLGNHIGVLRFEQAMIRRVTALLVIFVALRLLWRVTHLSGG